MKAQISLPNYLKIRQSPAFRERLNQRIKILREIRNFFQEKGFDEIDTPCLVRLPGTEPYLDVFETEFFDLKGDKERMFLITSPEYAMKKLLVAGFTKIFQITKSFRNKETDSQLHNPEFAILEWYRAHADYSDIMVDTIDLVRYLAKKIKGKKFFQYQGKTIDVFADWQILTVAEAFDKYAGISKDIFENAQKFKKAAIEKGYNITEKHSFDDVFFLIFLNEIEPNLGYPVPTILKEYPISMAALSRACPENPNYAERFECYVAGMELANAFSELTDPVEQKKRLEREKRQRQILEKTDYPVDQSFIDALQSGMPESGGIALGVDRLTMLLTDASDIRDIIFFPHRDL